MKKFSVLLLCMIMVFGMVACTDKDAVSLPELPDSFFNGIELGAAKADIVKSYPDVYDSEVKLHPDMLSGENAIGAEKVMILQEYEDDCIRISHQMDFDENDKLNLIATRYVLKDFGEDLTEEEIAEYINATKDMIIKKFSEIYGEGTDLYDQHRVYVWESDTEGYTLTVSYNRETGIYGSISLQAVPSE